MAKKVLFFYPLALYPAQTGTHQLTLEMLFALIELGYEVTLVSSTRISSNEWRKPAILELKSKGVKDIKLHRCTPWDYKLIKLYKFIFRPFSMMPTTTRLSSPEGLKRLFMKTADEIRPDIVFMNYVSWDHVIDHKKLVSARKIMQSHDLVTLGQQYHRKLKEFLPVLPVRANQVSDDFLREDFYERLNFSVDPEEFQIYDEYDYTIAVSQKEADVIRSNTKKTKVVFLPITQEPKNITNSYMGPALFPAGANLFNVQGYLYFVKKILPLIQVKIPDFTLQVTGPCTRLIFPELGTFFSGVVPDITSVYQEACFLISPLLGGTGQQVKIVEAMACGVPVIALKTVREALPLQHGVNGLLATSAEEFAEYAVELWNNRRACARLGQAGRKTIADNYSRDRLKEWLATLTA